MVADAMGVTGAGIFGDILCMRMVKRGVTALITDGVMRDKHGVLATGLPVWCAGVAAPASVNQLTFVGWNEPIGCGGCAIFPDDIIVADDDGAVVIPKDLADFVANEGAEHELLESWLVQEVEKGAKLPGLYPPNEENKKRYEDWKKIALMFFILSKTAAFLLLPSNLLIAFGLAGVALMVTRWRRVGVCMAVLGLILLWRSQAFYLLEACSLAPLKTASRSGTQAAAHRTDRRAGRRNFTPPFTRLRRAGRRRRWRAHHRHGEACARLS